MLQESLLGDFEGVQQTLVSRQEEGNKLIIAYWYESHKKVQTNGIFLEILGLYKAYCSMS